MKPLIALCLLAGCAGTQVVPSIGYTHTADWENLDRNAGSISGGLEFWPIPPPPMRQERITLFDPLPTPEPTDEGHTVIEGDWGKVKLSTGVALLILSMLGGGALIKKRAAQKETE